MFGGFGGFGDVCVVWFRMVCYVVRSEVSSLEWEAWGEVLVRGTFIVLPQQQRLHRLRIQGVCGIGGLRGFLWNRLLVRLLIEKGGRWERR